uniref:Uncharacterized protein n=1 Tax=Oryza punctata TaxID=4537 RepID=A0A0E0ML79_ORYPU
MPRRNRAEAPPLKRSPSSSPSPVAGPPLRFLVLGSKAEGSRRRRPAIFRRRWSTSQVAVAV